MAYVVSPQQMTCKMALIGSVVLVNQEIFAAISGLLNCRAIPTAYIHT